MFLVVASNLRISFENFNFNNTEKSTIEETKESKEAEKYKIKEKDKFNIKISLVLFKKITWLFVNLNKERLNKIAKKAHLNKKVPLPEKLLIFLDLKKLLHLLSCCNF